MPTYDPRTTALILIDLQQGIATDNKAPLVGSTVVERAKDLAARFREAGAPVVLVHVALDRHNGPSGAADKPSLPAEGTPPGFETFVKAAPAGRPGRPETSLGRVHGHRPRPAATTPGHPHRRDRRYRDQHGRRVHRAIGMGAVL